MSIDPIVEEIRAIRHEQFQKFNGSISAMCDDLRSREQQSPRERITFAVTLPISAPVSLPSPDVDPSPAPVQ